MSRYKHWDKPMNSLAGLRQRKVELRKEMEITKDLIGESLGNFIDRRTIGKAVSATLLSGAGAYFIRRIKANQAYRAVNMGLSSKAAGIASWMPMLRMGVEYLLDFLEARGRKKGRD